MKGMLIGATVQLRRSSAQASSLCVRISCQRRRRQAFATWAGGAAVNIDLRYTLQPGWQVLANVHNAFDRRYETFGVLGTNFFRGSG
jgi:outer membrane receptor protein involved in Fe transport